MQDLTSSFQRSVTKRNITESFILLFVSDKLDELVLNDDSLAASFPGSLLFQCLSREREEDQALETRLIFKPFFDFEKI